MAPRLLARALLLVALASLALPALPAGARPDENAHFLHVWERTDYPVDAGAAVRTWMWGPDAFSRVGVEPYSEAPGGFRQVQYFDKSRMELTHPAEDPDSPWFVTNGLLVVELIRGVIQVGDVDFLTLPGGPAQVNVAGDADDPTGPTYASFRYHLDDAPLAVGSVITQRIDRAGTVTYDPAAPAYGVIVGAYDDVTRHAIPQPFWEFMNASGTVWEDGAFVEDTLFLSPVYATGRPITEAYWANVKVGGSYRHVLTQCFERRCLTYTPDNPAAWRVEAGNVGQHYYTWRYGSPGLDPPAGGITLYDSDIERWTEWPLGTPNDDPRWLGDPDGSASWIGGIYRLRLDSHANVWLGARGDLPAYDDVRVTARIAGATAGGPDDRGCLLARVDDQGDDVRLYALCLSADSGVVAFYYESIGGLARLDWLLPPGAIHTGRPFGETNDLTLIARGHQFWCTINGATYGPVTHDGPLSGAVGVAAQRFTAAGADTRFDFMELRVSAVR